MYALENLKKGMRSAKIYIFTDNQATPKALKSKLLWAGLGVLVWCNIIGCNKQGYTDGDKLFKRGASNHFYGIELALGISKAQIKG